MSKALKFYTRQWLHMLNSPLVGICMLATLLGLGLAIAIGETILAVAQQFAAQPSWSLANIWLLGLPVWLVACLWLYHEAMRYSIRNPREELESGKNWLLLATLGTVFWPLTALGIAVIAVFSMLAYDG